MERKVPAFLAASFWELVRFFILFLTLTTWIGAAGPRANILALWVSAPQLVIAAGCLFLGLYPVRYHRFVNLIILGKLLSLFPGIVILVFQSEAIRFPGGNLTGSLAYVMLPAVILLMDLIFLVFLLSYRTDHTCRTERTEASASIGHSED